MAFTCVTHGGRANLFAFRLAVLAALAVPTTGRRHDFSRISIGQLAANHSSDQVLSKEKLPFNKAIPPLSMFLELEEAAEAHLDGTGCPVSATETDLFKVLGVDEDAEKKAIIKAYRKLALKCHPDHDRSEGSVARFQKLQEAHETLTDPAKREAYGRRCPAFAGSQSADSDGDCRCAPGLSCFQGGMLGCASSFGSRHSQYFRHTCQNCECRAPSSSGGGGRSTPGSCPAFAVSRTSDSDGDCQCDARGCYRQGRPGCPYSGGSSQRYFSRACEDCTCGESGEEVSCPASSVSGQADSDGDCQCPPSTTCYMHGSPGCRYSAGTASRTYFAASCFSCKCVAAGNSSDGGFPGAGGSCPAFAASQRADSDGECSCPQSTECYQFGTPGCTTIRGQSRTYFQATCSSCTCQSVATCPGFALSLTPDSDGDCKCPGEATCYQNGGYSCQISSGSRSSTYFKSSCTNCECSADVGFVSPSAVKKVKTAFLVFIALIVSCCVWCCCPCVRSRAAGNSAPQPPISYSAQARQSTATTGTAGTTPSAPPLSAAAGN